MEGAIMACFRAGDLRLSQVSRLRHALDVEVWPSTLADWNRDFCADQESAVETMETAERKALLA